MCVYVCVYICVCVCIYIYIYKYIYICNMSKCKAVKLAVLLCAVLG